MSRSDWYFLGFFLTALEACFIWWLAFVVYRRDSREFLNRMYALALVCLGLWAVSGFAEKITDNPGDAFTLWTFRWAYATASLGLVFFLLFLLTFYLGRSPRKRLTLSFLVLSTAMIAMSLSPLAISSASYRDGKLLVENGPLHGLLSILIALLSLASLSLLIRKWQISKGIDHARASVMLLGTVLFVPLAIIFTIVVPAVTGNGLISNYAFLAAAVPVAFTAYAVIRLRVLDTRVILRRTGVFASGTLLLSLPLVVAFALFALLDLDRKTEWVVILATSCIMIYLSPTLWKKVESLASRFFFAGMYDELQLLDEISLAMTAQSEMSKGLMEAMRRIVHALGLRELGLVMLEDPDSRHDRYLRVTMDMDEGHLNSQAPSLDWVDGLDSTLVTEELLRWPRTPQEERMGADLEAIHIAGCLPVFAVDRRVAVFLVGEKVSEKALSSNDLSLLEKAGGRIGLYINNYTLSVKLAAQLDELGEVYERLRKADDFKTEIIQVASHEFRTPVTVINGFAQTMSVNWDKLTDEQKMTLMDSIVSSCNRLTRLTDQFFTLSGYRDGESVIQRAAVRIKRLCQDLLKALNVEDRERIRLDISRDELIITDPRHMQTILGNILDNALRFSPPDEPVIVRAWSDSMNVFICIQDFGKGMPSRESDRIFEPFVRLEDVRYHSQGMGLGLHIVRVLSTLLGIDIEVESTPGRGTSVTLTMALR